jgi:glycolate oxidase iron-sulfur subunit
MTTTPSQGISRDLIRQCVQCGMCLSACPTFRLTGSELDSPRGRIFQMDLVRRGEVSADDPDYQHHIGFCLGCRACETACPSGVQYGALLEQARAVGQPASNWSAGLVRRVAASRWLLRTFGLAVRLYRRLGLQALARRAGLANRLPGSLRDAEASLPMVDGGVWASRLPHLNPSPTPRRYRVAFLEGCLMAEFLAQANRDTVEVLTLNGCEVVVPRGQGCCGALHLHSGDSETALRLARANVKAFTGLGVDAILTNSAGCGSTLKEYSRLLGDHAGSPLGAPVLDVQEFLDRIGIERQPPAYPLTVTYQDACHLAHAQRIREQPRSLLKSIPELTLIEMENPDWCCGSAGTYNLEQPEASRQLLDEKIAAIARTGAQVVAAANPGCLMQLSAGLERRGLTITARHPMAILADAYRRGGR